MLLGAPASLQGQTFSIPASGVMNNYDRVQIGQHEAFEAGAYIARSNDAGANWYNPAGLVQVDRTNLNASANAYEFTKTELVGIGTEVSRTRFASVGRFFGVVLGSPIIKNPNIRLGFSFSKPVGWSPGAIDAAASFQPGAGGTEVLNYYSLVEFSTSMPTLSVGLRLSDDFRVGAGVTWAITNMSISQELGDRWLQPTSYQAGVRNFNTDGSTSALVFGGGIQWDAGDHLRLGAQVRAPGLRLGGASSVTFTQAVLGPTVNTDLAFRDEEAEFNYKLPLFLGGGVAWVADGWQAEFDVRYYGSVSAYPLYSSDVSGRFVEQQDGSDPVVEDVAFADVIQDTRSVLNLAVGGSINLSKTFKLHAGFFTDNSPNAESDITIFRTLDLVGGSLGVSARIGRLSGSVGVNGATGSSTDREIGPSLSGSVADTKLKVTTFSIMYAFSFDF